MQRGAEFFDRWGRGTFHIQGEKQRGRLRGEAGGVCSPPSARSAACFFYRKIVQYCGEKKPWKLLYTILCVGSAFIVISSIGAFGVCPSKPTLLPLLKRFEQGLQPAQLSDGCIESVVAESMGRRRTPQKAQQYGRSAFESEQRGWSRHCDSLFSSVKEPD